MSVYGTVEAIQGYCKAFCHNVGTGPVLIVITASLICSVLSNQVAAQDIVQEFPINVICVTGGQLCEPKFSVTVETGGPLEAQYVVSSGHCSLVRVFFFVDGDLRFTSQFLEASSNTPLVDLGPVTPGPHIIEVQAEGQLGGCNFGQLLSWAGTLAVTTSLLELGEFRINVTTFIPHDHVIGSPSDFCFNEKKKRQSIIFGGDNRTFTPDSAPTCIGAVSCRTRQLVTVIPDEAVDLDGLKDGSLHNLTGITRSYGPAGSIIGSA